MQINKLNTINPGCTNLKHELITNRMITNLREISNHAQSTKMQQMSKVVASCCPQQQENKRTIVLAGGSCCIEQPAPFTAVAFSRVSVKCPLVLGLLTTSRRLTCIHAKLFPTVKRRTFMRHYSRNSYSSFGRHAIFSESGGSRLGDPGQKALQTTIEPTLCGFLPNPFIQHLFLCPTSVNREIFLHRQEGFCVGKFGRVVDQAVLENRRLCKHFRQSRLHYKRQALLKI